MSTKLQPLFIMLTLCAVFTAVSSDRENQDPQLGNFYVGIYDQNALKKDSAFARKALACEQAQELSFDQLCLKLDLEFLGASDEEIDAELAKEAKKIKNTAKKDLHRLDNQATAVAVASKIHWPKGKALSPDVQPYIPNLHGAPKSKPLAKRKQKTQRETQRLYELQKQVNNQRPVFNEHQKALLRTFS